MMLHNNDYDVPEIRALLTRLGAFPRYEGFYYVEYGLLLLKENQELFLAVTKFLYPEIARKFHTTDKSVERNIRTISELMWKHARPTLEELAGHPLEKRPAVSQLFAILYSYLTLGPR